MLLGNILLIIYVSLFSILACLYPESKFFAYSIWFIVDDNVGVFVYPPVILFLYQVLRKWYGKGIKEISYSKIFINLMLMLIVTYLLFCMIFIFGFYDGEHP